MQLSFFEYIVKENTDIGLTLKGCCNHLLPVLGILLYFVPYFLLRNT